MASDRRVLVVDDANRSGDRLSPALEGVDVATTDSSGVVLRLCRSRVDCLVLPAEEMDASADNVAYAVHGLFPDLPLVVFGSPPPETDDATEIQAASIDDAAVLTAIRDTLEAGTDSRAAAPPSRPETLLASFFEGIPAHLYAKDETARHLIASDSMMDPSELYGLTDKETYPGKGSYDEPNYADDQWVIETGRHIIELDEYSETFEQFFRTSKAPWRDESDSVMGLVGITQDITEFREQKKALRQQNRRLRKVALMTAHELRNELQVVSGHLSRAETDEAVEESVDRVVGIVDKIVSLATSHGPESETTFVWLSALVRDVWRSVAVPDATLSIEDDRRLVGDQDATELLIEMVLDNAIVHCGPGVTVTVEGTDTGFTIVDDGPGFPFDPPQQALEPGVTSNENESGFGLYIARQIANEQGWDIVLSNDNGARVEVTGVEHP